MGIFVLLGLASAVAGMPYNTYTSGSPKTYSWGDLVQENFFPAINNQQMVYAAPQTYFADDLIKKNFYYPAQYSQKKVEAPKSYSWDELVENNFYPTEYENNYNFNWEDLFQNQNQAYDISNTNWAELFQKDSTPSNNLNILKKFFVQPAVATKSSSTDFGLGSLGDLAIPNNFVLSDEMLEKTKSLAKNLSSFLRKLSSKPASAAFVEKMLKQNSNGCLLTIEESLAAIESVTKMLDGNEAELKAVMNAFNGLTKLKEPAEIVRKTGALLRLVKPLADKTDFNSLGQTCQTSGPVRSSNFFPKLQTTFAKLRNFCTEDNKINTESITAIGEMMDQMADIFGSFGDEKSIESIKKGKTTMEKITAGLKKLDIVGLEGNNCSEQGDLSGAADNLDGVATLIEDVGLEGLLEQFGADLSFDDFTITSAKY